MPKLFCVTYAFDLYIVADTQAAAEHAADREADYEFDNQMAYDCREDTREIKRHEDIPREWRDSLAYRDKEYAEDERTTAEWMEYILEAERTRKAAEPLPGQGVLFPVGDSEERATDAEPKV